MKYESSFKSEADNLEISIMAVIPDKKPYRAVVQLVHGMSEHKERYLPFMEYLAKLGYVTVIHDHRGHGKSVKFQEDLGFTYGGGAQAMLQDIRTVNRKKLIPIGIIILNSGILIFKIWLILSIKKSKYLK